MISPFHKRIRLAAAAITFGGAMLLSNPRSAVALSNWEPCSCEEYNGVKANAFDDCSGQGAPGDWYWPAGEYCYKQYLGAGWWDYDTGWSCIGGYQDPPAFQPEFCG